MTGTSRRPLPGGRRVVEADRGVQRANWPSCTPNVQGRWRPGGQSRIFRAACRPSIRVTTLPAGGHYQEFSQIDQPFSRYTNLTSLDASYDVGFATLSSTSSYYTTSGSTLEDNTYDLAGIDSEARFCPTTPERRPIRASCTTTSSPITAHTFTRGSAAGLQHAARQHVRLCAGRVLREAGALGAWTIAIPGSPERAAVLPCASSLRSFCVGPNDVNFQQIDTQNFQDKSVFGELTYHFLTHGQITFGVRHFSQEFTDAQSYVDYTFPTIHPGDPAQLARVQDRRQGRSVVRVRQEPVRLCIVVAGLPPRRRQLGAAVRAVPGEPGAVDLSSPTRPTTTKPA